MKYSAAATASFCVLAVILMARPASAAPAKVVATPAKTVDNNSKGGNDNKKDDKNDKNSGKDNHGKDCDDVKDCKDKDCRSQSVPCDSDHGKCDPKDKDDH